MDIKTESTWLMFGDCLERMKEIPDGSVDMILTDPPYGTMKGIKDVKHGMSGKTEWDEKLNTEEMFNLCYKILRKNGTLVLFSQDPYTTELIINSPPSICFTYRMIWVKDHFANGLLAKKAPVNYFEDILVFRKNYIAEKNYEQKNPAYIYLKQCKNISNMSTKDFNFMCSSYVKKTNNPHRSILARAWETSQFLLPSREIYEEVLQPTGFFEKSYDDVLKLNDDFEMKNQTIFNLPENEKTKSNVLQYKKDYTGLHPTQKPVLLLEDLIKTYSNHNDMVVDFTMGSGSTGVACKNTNRKFIGIEMDPTYYGIACGRILAS